MHGGVSLIVSSIILHVLQLITLLLFIQSTYFEKGKQCKLFDVLIYLMLSDRFVCEIYID